MKTITLKDALFGETSLKELREEEKIELPIEYIESSRNLALALGIYFLMLGFVAGMFFGALVW